MPNCFSFCFWYLMSIGHRLLHLQTSSLHHKHIKNTMFLMCCQTQSKPLLDSLGLEELWSLPILLHVLILSAVSGSLWARAPLCGSLHVSRHHMSCSNSRARQVQSQLNSIASMGIGRWGNWGLGVWFGLEWSEGELGNSLCTEGLTLIKGKEDTARETFRVVGIPCLRTC